MDEDRNGVLLVRVWLEGGGDHFRARLTAPDPARGGESGRELTIAVTSCPADVAQAVGRWLESFLEAARGR